MNPTVLGRFGILDFRRFPVWTGVEPAVHKYVAEVHIAHVVATHCIDVLAFTEPLEKFAEYEAEKCFIDKSELDEDNVEKTNLVCDDKKWEDD